MAAAATKNNFSGTHLLFTVEVFLANSSAILADLSSAKYTLLSFSDKSRNEVKLKSSLIPSLRDAYRELLDGRRSLHEERRKLNELETRLVQSAPPKFRSLEEVHSLDTTMSSPSACNNHCSHDVVAPAEGTTTTTRGMSSSSTKEDSIEPPVARTKATASPIEKPADIVVSSSSSDATGGGAGEAHKQHTPSDDAGEKTVLVPSNKDIKRVRESEALLEEEREELARLAKETNEIEDELKVEKSRCEDMTRHMNELKKMYEDVQAELMEVRNERSRYNTLQQEWEGRRDIYNEAQRKLEELYSLCCQEELLIISADLDDVRSQISKNQKELEEKKSSNEVELAVYQIAYKEQQAAAEELKDAVSQLHQHQRELEWMAKRQEFEKFKRNSIRRLLMSSLNILSDSGEALPQHLTIEELNEVKKDHHMVSIVATRIGLMEARRRALAAELLHITPAENDTTRVRCALQRMRNLLSEEIVVDESAIQNDGGFAQWSDDEPAWPPAK